MNKQVLDMLLKFSIAWYILILFYIFPPNLRRVDDFSFFDCSSPFCFLLIVFHHDFSISYIVLTFYVWPEGC